MKPLEEILEPVKDLTLDNVTSDDKETLEEVKEELEFVLTDEGLSEDDRKAREDALKDVQDMLDRIQDAADAITTDPILDTKDITAENVVLEDKDNIIVALEDLYGALEDYENNYTAVSGSTIVPLKESYAQTLTAGKHSIKFVYPDGEAVGSFTVVIPTNGSAETGDEAQILFWSSAMVVSLAALAVMMAASKKRRYAK